MADQKEKIIGGFKVLQELQAGSGSQGTVYKAACVEDKHGLVPIGTVVALKVMAVQDEGGAQWRKLQKRTAELARLDHPNVVKYYGCFSEQGLFNDVHVVVQEFLQGATLKGLLSRRKTGLDVDEALRVVDAALAGLEYTAGRGLVHRDVKPGNIIVCDDGRVKLIDFEIAKQEGGTVTASVGNIRGSFDYMAPDFTNPEFRGDVQSDVFSMGVVLHEALTGKTPYERLDGDDKQANFAFLSRWSQTLSEGHSPIHVSSRIRRLLAHADDVLARSLAPRREARYKNFTEFREGLRAIRFRSLKNGATSYQLLQFIGKGGFGEVFKARSRQTGQLVAVKHLMKAAYAERFHREAKIMKKLQDPCFVQLVDFFVMESGGGQEAFLVMAFLDGMPGSSLRDAIKRRAEVPMEWRDVFIAFTRYARGLLAMHRQGIFHRDIKPSNLYYPEGRPGSAAIMDLGIARDVNGTATTGQVPGTLDYMPPEVVISDSRGDGGMDIYALGLCLYESLTGKMAFPRLPTGSTAYATFFERAKTRQNPTFAAPEVQGDAEILSLLTDMTNPDASRRLRNAGVLVMRLESIMNSRYGGESRGADDEAATVAATVAMPGGDDAGTVATSAMEGPAAAAIERERRRIAELGGKPGRRFAALAIAALLLAAAGTAVYFFRAPVMEKVKSWGLGSTAVAPRPSARNSEDPASRAQHEREDAERIAAQQEQQLKFEKQQAELKKQQDEMERQRRELEKQQKAIRDEEARLAREAADRKAKEDADRKAREEAVAKAEEDRLREEARIAADKTKTEAEKAAARLAAEKKAAAEKAKLDAEEAEAKARRDKEDAERIAAQKEQQRKFDEQQSALKRQQEEMEQQRRELEEQQRKLEEARRAKEKDEAERKAREDEERKKREAAEKAAADKAAEEARKKTEAELSARLAEMQRQLEEANRKAEEEKRLADEARKKAAAEAARLADERKAAEEKAAKEREEAEKRRKAAEAREKAEREAEAKRLEEERQKVLEAQRKQQAEADRIAREKAEAEKAKQEAEAARRKAEEDAARLAAQMKQREATARDFVSKAGMYYESEEYYSTVKAYRDAVKSGHSMSAVELQEFEDAYKKADARLKQIRARCEDQIRVGQTPLRSIKDLDAESKNLVDWHFDVTGR